MSKPVNPKSQSLGTFPIGIDFGTTNSVMSRYAHTILKDGPESLNFPLTGSMLYPSIALVDAEISGIRTGIAAYNKRFTEPEKIVSSVKRKITENTRYRVNDNSYSNVDIAEAIISDFVKEIRMTDHDLHPNIIVVTVPYYFGENENALLKQAAENAIHNQLGYTAEIYLLPEPVAASITSIYNLTLENIQSKVFFIYDIGGGTLDLTLLRITNDAYVFSYEVLANDGIAQFGGDDIDELLYEYVVNHEHLNFSLLNQHQQMINRAKLLDECKEAKHHLSSSESYSFMCSNLLGIEKGYIELNLSREVFSSILSGLHGSKRNMLLEFNQCVDRLYAKAKVNKESIDYTIPVGGTSFIPLFKDCINDLHSHAKEIVTPNPIDNFVIVANGASIYAAMKSDELYHTNYHPFTHQNAIEKMKTRVSHSLFLEKYNGKLDLIIPANSMSPVCIKKTYYPSKLKNEGKIVDLDTVHLYQGQGESRKAGSYIGGIDFSSYTIFAHERKIDDIPIHIKIEASDTLVTVSCCIPKSDKYGNDIIFTQIIHG